MDRAITKEELKKERYKSIIKWSVASIASMIAITTVFSFIQESVSEKHLIIYTTDRGNLDVSISASGKIVPAFEEVINSPINSRILETYMNGGDSVDIGTPILKLDLQTVETEYNKLLDEEQMKLLQLEQLRITNNNKLSEMEMKLKISHMELNRKEVELRNEQYLDSLGAGTTDKVRQVELSYNVSVLQLREDEQKYENEQALAMADIKLKGLELAIFSKSIAEMRRTLEDARILSPRKAILTYINNEIGSQVSTGTRVAVVSDLSHFKIEGEIADSYGDRIAAGSRVLVRMGSERLNGIISEIIPLSRNGVIKFIVQLEENGHPRLRSGLKTDIYVMTSIKDDVVRIANNSYYKGAGDYELFVVEDDKLVKRKVYLGDSNFEMVEVLSGLEVGDRVVISDMSSYSNKTKLNLDK
jgi:hypothetical protein